MGSDIDHGSALTPEAARLAEEHDAGRLAAALAKRLEAEGFPVGLIVAAWTLGRYVREIGPGSPPAWLGSAGTAFRVFYDGAVALGDALAHPWTPGKPDREVIYGRAARAYGHRCNEEGRLYSHPARSASDISDAGSVLLRNEAGEPLARFTYDQAADRLDFAGWG